MTGREATPLLQLGVDHTKVVCIVEHTRLIHARECIERNTPCAQITRRSDYRGEIRMS